MSSHRLMQPSLTQPSLLKFSLFGLPKIQLDGIDVTGFSTSKSHALLIYLATEGGSKSREELATLFWQEMPNPKARKNLRDALYSLRKVVGDHMDIAPQSVAMIGPPISAETTHHSHPHISPTDSFRHSVDVIQFRKLLSQTTAEATAHQRDALSLYKGDFLEGFKVRKAPAFDEWVRSERELLRQQAVQNAVQVVKNDISNGAYEEGLKLTTWLLALAPLNEQAHLYKLQLLLQSGDRSAALEHYDAYSEMLVDTHRMEPWPPIVELIDQINSGEQGTAAQGKKPQNREQLGEEVQHEGELGTGELGTGELGTGELGTGELGTGEQGSKLSRGEEQQGDVLFQNGVLGRQSHPIYSTNFIGYQKEIAYVQWILTQSEYRLLTIIGPGGVGKTRLVIESINQLFEQQNVASHFRDGIYIAYFEALQLINSKADQAEVATRPPRLTASEKIIVAIADALDLHFEGSASPKEQLLAYLRPKSALIIVDSFEELLPGAGLLTELLTNAPKIRIVATSRERLNLYSERLLTLEGLPTGNLDGRSAMQRSRKETTAPMHKEAYASKLLLDRIKQLANQLGESYQQPNQEEIGLIQRICHLTGGIPLALEIAAALSIQMGLADLVDTLEDDLNILQFSGKGIQERHSNIYAVLDATWQRLTRQEQMVLRRLVIFKGGFSLDAAEAIAGASHEILSSLVNKSVIWVSGRYSMHMLVHQYISQKFIHQNTATNGSMLEIQTKHCQYFEDYLTAKIDHWRRTHDAQALSNLVLEYDNIMTAWQCRVAQSQSPALVTFAKNLWLLAQQRGRLHEIIRIIHDMFTWLHHHPAPPIADAAEIKAELQQLLSVTYYWLGDLNRSDAHGREALRLLGQKVPSSKIGLSIALIQEFGQTLCRRLLPAKSVQCLNQKSMMGWIYKSLTQNSYMLSNLPESALCSLRAANLAEQTNEYSLQTYAYATTGVLFGLLRLVGLRRFYMGQAEQSASKASDLAVRPIIPFLNGLALISSGECDIALPLIESALEQFKQAQQWRNAGDCLALLNIIACYQGRHEAGLAYGMQLAAIADASQNQEHNAWAGLIQAVNLVQLDHASEALVILEKVEPLYEELSFRDIGLFVGYSTRSLVHFRLAEYEEAIAVAKRLTALSNYTLPTSPIYLYVYHAILEVFLRTIELAQSNSTQPHSTQPSKNRTTGSTNVAAHSVDFNQAELRRYAKQWLRKLTLFSWIHPIGRQHLWLHKGRFSYLTGRPNQAEGLFRKGIDASERLGHTRNYARFHYEIGKHIASNTDERELHLQTAINIYQNLECPYGLKVFRQAIEEVHVSAMAE